MIKVNEFFWAMRIKVIFIFYKNIGLVTNLNLDKKLLVLDLDETLFHCNENLATEKSASTIDFFLPESNLNVAVIYIFCITILRNFIIFKK